MVEVSVVWLWALQSISVSQTLLNYTNKLDVLILYIFKVYATINNHSTELYISQNIQNILSWVEQLKKKEWIMSILALPMNPCTISPYPLKHYQNEFFKEEII